MSMIRRSPLWGAIIIIILAITMVFMMTNLHYQNTKLQKENNELRTSIDNQEDTIDSLNLSLSDLTAQVETLKDESGPLKEENALLKEDNNSLKEEKDTLIAENAQLKKDKDFLQAEVHKEVVLVRASNMDFKSYMPYTAITNKNSRQWELQQKAYTNAEGIRCIDGRPLVAVGTGWGLSVGDVAVVICENGNSFEIMVGDIKSDKHTLSDNKTSASNDCRCEFIVDMDKLIPYIKDGGNMAKIQTYNGYVIDIQKK